MAYDSFPCPTSHPDGLAAIGALFGMKPAPVPSCRVLELGCGTGANLLPLAAALPEGRFVGIDLSASQIETARKGVAALGLSNATFEVVDLAAAGAPLGTFDYVIAHGVLSWVPPAAQEGLLRTVRACLAEQGIAYVSYAVQPGSSARQALREMLTWSARAETDPARRVAQARSFAEFLAVHLPTRAPQAVALRKLIAELGGTSDAYLLHDYLAEVHQAFTLTQFIDRASAQQLRYFADAQFHTLFAPELDAKLPAGALGVDPTPAAREQLHDFFNGRSFRTSLLCRSEVTLAPAASAERLSDLFLTTTAQPRGQEDGHWMFRAAGGELFGTPSDLVGSALAQLSEAHPRPVSFAALCDLARGGVDGKAAEPADMDMLRTNLLAAFAAGQVSLGTYDRGVRSAGEEPVRAFASARLQASSGAAGATNLWHRHVEIAPSARRLLPLLDGTRTRAQVLADFVKDQPTATEAELDEQLSFLAENAFLVG